MSEKPKKPSSAADVLQRLFENSKSPLSDGFQRWKLETRWSDIVGPTISKNSRPVFYDNGTLIVEVANASWMNEIRFFTEDIKYKVNQHVGSSWVQKIHFIHK